jgi:hypothetical protein
MYIDITHCVSEQGQTQILWTVFEGQPFSSRRIASFSTEEDARYWIGALEIYQVFNELKSQDKIQHLEDMIDMAADKARLDWLATQSSCVRGTSIPKWSVEGKDSNEDQNIREAIDRAMKQLPATG